jgi:hypothetical protein
LKPWEWALINPISVRRQVSGRSEDFIPAQKLGILAYKCRSAVGNLSNYTRYHAKALSCHRLPQNGLKNIAKAALSKPIGKRTLKLNWNNCCKSDAF